MKSLWPTVVGVVSALGLLAAHIMSTSNSYNEGHNDGLREGYNRGYNKCKEHAAHDKILGLSEIE